MYLGSILFARLETIIAKSVRRIRMTKHFRVVRSTHSSGRMMTISFTDCSINCSSSFCSLSCSGPFDWDVTKCGLRIPWMALHTKPICHATRFERGPILCLTPFSQTFNGKFHIDSNSRTKELYGVLTDNNRDCEIIPKEKWEIFFWLAV